MYSDNIDCLLNAENIRKLKEDDIDRLCELISVDKLRNCVVEYHKDPTTKKKKYGKDDKSWKKVNNEKPDSGFILLFFEYKLLKEDPIDELVLKALNEKFLKTILGKNDYKNPSIEKIVSAIDSNENYTEYDKCLLKKVISEEVSDEDFEKAKSDNPKPGKKGVTLNVVTKKAVILDELSDEDKIKELQKKVDELNGQVNNLKTTNKDLQNQLDKEKGNTEQLRKEAKEKEKDYNKCRKDYEELKKKLDLVMNKEKVHIDYENGDFDKANLMNLQKAIEDGFKAKDYKALQKIMVKTYVILGVFDGGKKK